MLFIKEHLELLYLKFHYYHCYKAFHRGTFKCHVFSRCLYLLDVCVEQNASTLRLLFTVADYDNYNFLPDDILGKNISFSDVYLHNERM